MLRRFKKSARQKMLGWQFKSCPNGKTGGFHLRNLRSNIEAKKALKRLMHSGFHRCASNVTVSHGCGGAQHSLPEILFCYLSGLQ